MTKRVRFLWWKPAPISRLAKLPALPPRYAGDPPGAYKSHQERWDALYAHWLATRGEPDVTPQG